MYWAVVILETSKVGIKVIPLIVYSFLGILGLYGFCKNSSSFMYQLNLITGISAESIPQMQSISLAFKEMASSSDSSLSMSSIS